MFEVFFFINPIGIYCYDIEKTVIQTATDLNLDVTYHYLPLASMNIAEKDIIRRRQENQNLANFSRYTIALHCALEFYHAIRLAYGNKKARLFLFQLQQKLNNNETIFSRDLILRLCQENGLNKKIIFSLLNSNYVISSIEQDEELARKWQIKQTPTMIIYDENKVQDCGLMLEGLIDKEKLQDLFQPQPANIRQLPLFSCNNNYLRLI